MLENVSHTVVLLIQIHLRLMRLLHLHQLFMVLTRVDDFMFFVNGQLMESDALTIQQQGSTLRLDINSNNIGYDLTNDDEVVGWGKFNS